MLTLTLFVFGASGLASSGESRLYASSSCTSTLELNVAIVSVKGGPEMKRAPSCHISRNYITYIYIYIYTNTQPRSYIYIYSVYIYNGVHVYVYTYVSTSTQSTDGYHYHSSCLGRLLRLDLPIGVHRPRIPLLLAMDTERKALPWPWKAPSHALEHNNCPKSGLVPPNFLKWSCST